MQHSSRILYHTSLEIIINILQCQSNSNQGLLRKCNKTDKLSSRQNAFTFQGCVNIFILAHVTYCGMLTYWKSQFHFQWVGLFTPKTLSFLNKHFYDIQFFDRNCWSGCKVSGNLSINYNNHAQILKLYCLFVKKM